MLHRILLLYAVTLIAVDAQGQPKYELELDLGSQAVASKCQFQQNMDYADPAGPVIPHLPNPQACCDACTKLASCVVAVWQASTGSCYTKTAGKLPHGSRCLRIVMLLAFLAH